VERKNDSESRLKEFHVAEIVLRWSVPLPMALHLRFRGEAPNFAACDSASSAEGRRREGPFSSIGQVEESVSSIVECDGMYVDLTPERI